MPGTGLTSAGRQSIIQGLGGIRDVAETGDNCGTALAAGDFNLDTFDDLVIGCPFEDVPGNSDMGAVNVLYGANTRPLTANQFFTFTDVLSFQDKCSTGLATGDFNADQVDDLAVGCPGHDVGVVASEATFGTFDAGRVVVLYGGGPALTTTGRQSFTQDTAGIAGIAETGDAFGFGLAGMGGLAAPGLTGVWQGDVVQTCNSQHCMLRGTFEVINPSTQRVPQTALRFFLSADRVLDAGDLVLSDVGVGALKPGERTTRQLAVRVPDGTSASGQYVIAFADADNVVVEVNEANNIVVFGPIQ